MKRAFAVLLLVSTFAAEASADKTLLFQVDVGGAYSWVDHPAAYETSAAFGSVGGISLNFAVGAEDRRWAIAGDVRLDIQGGAGERQSIYARLLLGPLFILKLSPRWRLGLEPALGFHAGNVYVYNDGGEYQPAFAFDIGGTAQLTVDLLKRKWDGSALYLSFAATYVYSPGGDDISQAMSYALSLGYRASTRATSVFSAPRW